MKKLMKSITICLLLVCLSISVVACKPNDDKPPEGPPAPPPEASILGDNLGNVNETVWIEALTLPAEIENFTLISKSVFEDSQDPSFYTETIINISISKTALFGSQIEVENVEGTPVTTNSVVAMANVQDTYYIYSKAKIDNVDCYGFDGNSGLTPESMYFQTLISMAVYKDFFSQFAYSAEKEAFVVVQDSTEMQISFYENGFTIKRIQSLETMTYTSEFSFANINSTTVTVPQSVIDDINGYILNPDAYNPFPAEPA